MKFFEAVIILRSGGVSLLCKLCERFQSCVRPAPDPAHYKSGLASELSCPKAEDGWLLNAVLV